MVIGRGGSSAEFFRRVRVRSLFFCKLCIKSDDEYIVVSSCPVFLY